MVHEIQQQAWRRRRIWRLAIAAVAVLVLATAIVVAAGLAGPPSRPAPGASAPATATAAPAVTGPVPGPSGAGDPGLDQVTWTEWQGLSLPVSPVHGPLHSQSGRVSGFSRDTPGAVLAAIHVSVRSQSHAGPRVFRPTIDAQVTGPDTDAYLALMESEYEAARIKSGRPPDAALPQPQVRFMGWRVESGSATKPVHLLLAGDLADGSQRCVDARLVMVWSQGDWQLTAPPGGNGSALMSEAACEAPGYRLLPQQG